MFEGPGELGPQIIRRNVIYEPAEDVLGDLDGAVGEGHDGYTEFVTANTRFAYEFASFGGSTFPI